MELKEVLHLYLGCEMQKKLAGRNEGIAILDGIDGSVYTLIEHGMLVPILRPLSDMTEDELLYVGKLFGWNHLTDDSIIAQTKELMTTNYFYIKQTNIKGGTWVKVFAYLISIGIDLFGLIESGQAIDKLGQKVRV